MPAVIVVGAGMAGLTAASTLVAAGFDVVVLDKGRAVGGRMATRTVEDATYDYGTQHFSSRTQAFRSVVAGWLQSGLAREWYRGQSLTQPGRGLEPRLIGANGMRSITEHLGSGVDVRTGVEVSSVGRSGHDIVVATGSSEPLRADAAIITPPVPQTLTLLDTGRVGVDDKLRRALEGVEYDACCSVMARLEGATGLDRGHRAIEGGRAAWIADNQHKGITDVPAVTIHSSLSFAAEQEGVPADDWVPVLVAAAQPHLASPIVSAKGHRWRYSQPRNVLVDGAAFVNTEDAVVIAGEAMAGAKVEGAFTSGKAAAALLIDRLG